MLMPYEIILRYWEGPVCLSVNWVERALAPELALLQAGHTCVSYYGIPIEDVVAVKVVLLPTRD